MMKKCFALFILLALVASGCDGQARRDSIHLDSILATQAIDRIEVVSLYRTNYLHGTNAQQIVAALNHTNRVAVSQWNRDSVAAWFMMFAGTNEVLVVRSFETGQMEFGDHCFRLKSSPDVAASEE